MVSAFPTIKSGALHYFRVLPEQWRHRLQMLRAMGLDTVETYVPWNLHERRPGRFERLEEITRFLDEAREEGLKAIVRPGPYICAEWENGGHPAWLTGRLRCMDKSYLDAVDRWFDVLIPLIAQQQDNVIMVQVENEYGSYGSDQEYLRHLTDGLVRRGITVPLFTSDGPEDWMLTGGTIPGILATVNFGSEPEKAFADFRRIRPDDPLFCMEFWCGWFDHWGSPHVGRDAKDAADTLQRILDAGASVNIYMAHGGTNFGTWAGSNRSDRHLGALLPTVTSYDYDAPIDERGAPTEKFWLFREVLGGSAPLPGMPPLLEPATVDLVEWAPLSFGPPVKSAHPLTFEELGLTHGLVRYEAELPQREPLPLHLDGLADRAWLTVDGVSAPLDQPIAGPARIEILVESLGRTNYGPKLGDRKGIVGGVRHGQQFVHGFTAYPLEMMDLDVSAAAWSPGGSHGVGNGLRRGWFDVERQADGWLGLPGFGRGYVWVNGFLLGRYSDEGPQERLYIPWPLVSMGRNEVVVLELDINRCLDSCHVEIGTALA